MADAGLQAAREAPPCYHCGEDIPPGVDLHVEIGGEARAMCCPGCRAVATMITSSGLDTFYQQRTAYSERPVEPQFKLNDQYLVYDDPQTAAQFADMQSDGTVQARVLLGGITCAACTWLIEQTLAPIPGISSALVNLQQSRLDVAFDPAQIKLSEIFSRLESLGYRPRPFQVSTQVEQMHADYKRDLRRLGVAGFGMMQVGMYAIALHAGEIQGIQQQYEGLLRWVSLLVASFVVYYSAGTFFSTAWRHLKQGALVMDLPVALAIGLALLASAWATISGTGQVYFDSVVMFTFFLLLGRFLEARVRQRHTMTWFDAESTLPDAVSCRRDGQWQTVPRAQLVVGDTVLFPPGQTIAIDAIVTKGSSAVREDTFNGEHLPRSVAVGDTVYAGTINMEAGLEAQVLCNYLESRLAALQKSVEVAQTEKPALARMADRIASWFVAGVLLVTSATAFIWYQIDPSQALWISLSVLVISCPCALALATPAALTAAASALRTRGVIVRGENALEALSRTTHVLFDKTGTLTEGNLSIAEVQLLGSAGRTEVLAIASALQHFSNHPLGSAFADLPGKAGLTDVEYTVGAGMAGMLNGHEYRMGSEPFCRALLPGLTAQPRQELYWVALCSDEEALAWIGLNDPLRSEARCVVAQAQHAGLTVGLLTGDRSAAGTALAEQLQLDSCAYGLRPQEKMAQVQALQADGHVVTMVGDGLNDAPVLGMADASFAVAGATDLARTQADFVVAGGDLDAITRTWHQARRCRRIILQNFGWSLGYNISAIPLAAMGYIPPWAAAIGMSLSSLIVVANSLRLSKEASLQD